MISLNFYPDSSGLFFRVFELRIGERLFQKTNKYILRHHICFMALLINLSEIGGINKTETSLEKV